MRRLAVVCVTVLTLLLLPSLYYLIEERLARRQARAQALTTATQGAQ